MKHSVVLLGWDVGPWKCSGESKDALVVVGWDGRKLSVIGKGFHGNIFSRLNGTLTAESLLEAAECSESSQAAQIIIAVDAVLGWPSRFVELTKGQTKYEPKMGSKDKNMGNRFLYRETERFLVNSLSLKSPNLPKTAVGDAIGSAATKAQYVVSTLRRSEEVYVPPLDPWGIATARKSRITVIEVYPGVTTFSERFENFDLPQGSKMRLLGKSDPEDAVRCAMVGVCYSQRIGLLNLEAPDIYIPTDAQSSDGYDVKAIASEGWIFSPKR